MRCAEDGNGQILADYDWRDFSAALNAKRRLDPRGLRALAGDIGVTFSDLSRILGGQPVSVPKVIALCRWLDVPVEAFYIEPDLPANSVCCSGNNVKHPVQRGVS